MEVKATQTEASDPGAVNPGFDGTDNPTFTADDVILQPGTRVSAVQVLLLPSATKLRQGNVFTPVCHSVHRGGSATHTHTHTWADTPGKTPPPGQTPFLGRHPSWADTLPPGRDPSGRYHQPPVQCMLGYGQQVGSTPPEQTQPPPLGRHLPGAVHAGIRSTSGRYASYWNAILFQNIFLPF